MARVTLDAFYRFIAIMINRDVFCHSDVFGSRYRNFNVTASNFYHLGLFMVERRDKKGILPGFVSNANTEA